MGNTWKDTEHKISKLDIYVGFSLYTPFNSPLHSPIISTFFKDYTAGVLRFYNGVHAVHDTGIFGNT
jgi:hypothetical protein